MNSNESPPRRSWRSPSVKTIGIASAVSVLGAAIVVSVATAMVVNADEVAQKEQAAVIAEDSTSTNSPEAGVVSGEPPAPLAAELISLPREPLTLDEIAYARALSASHETFAAAGAAAGKTPTYLSTTIPDPESFTDGNRRLEVVYYDYGVNQVLRYVVNVTSGQIEIADAASGVQPPPSDTEITAAFELLLADPLSAPAKRAFLDLEGTALTSPDQTSYNGSSFIHTAGTIGAEECGVDRCVMLLVQTPDHVYLPTTDIVVNLSRSTVIPIQ